MCMCLDVFACCAVRRKLCVVLQHGKQHKGLSVAACAQHHRQPQAACESGLHLTPVYSTHGVLKLLSLKALCCAVLCCVLLCCCAAAGGLCRAAVQLAGQHVWQYRRPTAAGGLPGPTTCHAVAGTHVSADRACCITARSAPIQWVCGQCRHIWSVGHCRSWLRRVRCNAWLSLWCWCWLAATGALQLLLDAAKTMRAPGSTLSWLAPSTGSCSTTNTSSSKACGVCVLLCWCATVQDAWAVDECHQQDGPAAAELQAAAPSSRRSPRSTAAHPASVQPLHLHPG